MRASPLLPTHRHPAVFFRPRMIDKDPSSYSFATYVWVLGLSSLAGIVSFMRKVKRGRARSYSVAEFIGEVGASALAGVVTFWLCQNAGISQLLTAAFVGISGHMGSRALALFEEWAERHFPVSGECSNTCNKQCNKR